MALPPREPHTGERGWGPAPEMARRTTATDGRRRPTLLARWLTRALPDQRLAYPVLRVML